MSYSVGGVTIPGPASVTKTIPAKVEEFELDGDKPVLIVPGLRATQLTIEGVFTGTKSTLESTYLTALEALKGTEVTVVFPDTRYDGSWVFAEFTYTEINAKQFKYTIRLLQGSSHVIL